MSRMRDRDVDGARALVATGEGRRRMDRVRGLVHELVASQEATVASLRRRAERTRDQLFLAYGMLVLVALAIGGYGVVLVRRELRALEDASRALAHAERKAREGQQWFRMIAEGASDLVRVHDRDGHIEYASPSAARLLGYAPDELVSRDAMTFVHEDDRAALVTALRDALARDDAPPLLHRMLRKDGSVRWFETRIQPARDESGAIERLHTVSRDVTERVELEASRSRETSQLVELMHRDELTGLYNRRGFHEHAGALLARGRAEDRPVLFVFCDVNGLKVINDELGHEAGDDVIRDAGALLRACARDTDVVARLGGDELVVAAMVRDEDAAGAFDRRLRELVRAHNAREERPFRVSLSVGSALWRARDGKDLEAMVQEADAAMYAQKRARRSAVTTSGEAIVRTRPKA
ncbi:diguanylate cyclase/phosphodiesterase (GGDEF & EAL domains) with PAS/PAC sensor(s) [Sandaracinus amylolyticus]|uniref:Diguanylate cyclase/phosphodiesterase (GGDEF & EAL domains) with PAS/PAC sensor(S) n=1 Tax=Sandaracinus amylolyticus TaxID=927083 RepID=A0A0F6SE35_9BACT|nr:diguanylate cyclase/phosphodiesterase (GGDEF & EAL domains) with PAS/PAC sensor(s) [Sandaracinus amylolyticus]